MPAASVYFRDPAGHGLEVLAMLDKADPATLPALLLEAPAKVGTLSAGLGGHHRRAQAAIQRHGGPHRELPVRRVPGLCGVLVHHDGVRIHCMCVPERLAEELLRRRVPLGRFSPANIVPGVGFTPGKRLKSRPASHGITQRHRLGVHFNRIPVNAPKCPFHR
ncbi:catalase [Siccirubricoccus sp. G192]|nr:catalase [Siccirubricoccus sp. G192]